MLERVAISFSRGSSWARDRPTSPAFAGRLFTLHHQGSPSWQIWHRHSKNSAMVLKPRCVDYSDFLWCTKRWQNRLEWKSRKVLLLLTIYNISDANIKSKTRTRTLYSFSTLFCPLWKEGLHSRKSGSTLYPHLTLRGAPTKKSPYHLQKSSRCCEGSALSESLTCILPKSQLTNC